MLRRSPQKLNLANCINRMSAAGIADIGKTWVRTHKLNENSDDNFPSRTSISRPVACYPPIERRRHACRRGATAGHIGGEVRIFVQHTRRFQPEQHPAYHHQVARAGTDHRADHGIAKAKGKLAQPVTDADPRREACVARTRTCRPSRSLQRFRVQGSAAPPC